MTLDISAVPLQLTFAEFPQGQRWNEPIVQSISSTLIVYCFSLIHSDVTSKLLYPALQRYLSPTGIIPTVESYTIAACELLEKNGSRLEGVSTPLHDFVLPVVYQASAYAFFGRSFPAEGLWGPFNDFGGSFHLMLAGVPRDLLRTHVNGLATMHKLLREYFDGPHDDASELVLESEQVMRNHGYVRYVSTPGNIETLIQRDSRIRTPPGFTSSLSYLL